MFKLDKKNGSRLWRQVYQSLKNQMLSGELKAGESVPSTRELGKLLNVSRNTVCQAYDMLIAEGYLISRQGAATRVADGLIVGPASLPQPKIKEDAAAISVSFQTGKPDLRQFPRFLWQQLLHKASYELPVEMYGYYGPQGLPCLRTEITEWLFRNRGLKIDPNDIFITAGATHALHLTADLLCNEGKSILIEDPCNIGMLQTFINRRCPLVPIPVDSDGIQSGYLPKCGNIAASYVTPSHQFPLGGILPASRRAAMIRFAKDNDSYIIEDDYDSEFRYSGDPIAPLYAICPQRVIYVGTFSKTIFPALRIGYVILPYQLQKNWCDLRTHTDVQNPPFEQAALAEFLRTRKFDRHVSKMRRIYSQRRQALMDSLKKTFGNMWTAYGDAAGMHAVIDFPGMSFNKGFREKCLQSGIYITPLEDYCIEKGRHQSKLLIGYGHLEPEEINKGIRLLSNAIHV